MSELVKLIEGLGSAVDEMRKSNDRAIEEMQKGNDARAREFEAKADRANTEISELQKDSSHGHIILPFFTENRPRFFHMVLFAQSAENNLFLAIKTRQT